MREEMFKELVASVREGGAILRGKGRPARGFVVDGPNIRRIRTNYDLSQGDFAALLGISVATLRNWEQGRRRPEGPARVLLQVAAKHPDAVWDTVRPVSRRQGKTTTRMGRLTRGLEALKREKACGRRRSGMSRRLRTFRAEHACDF